MADELTRNVPPHTPAVRKVPPVVARLVVEIRSDGSHTIARGAAEDLLQGTRVEVNAAGSTPLQLVFSLLKSLKDVPALSRAFAVGLLKKG